MHAWPSQHTKSWADALCLNISSPVKLNMRSAQETTRMQQVLQHPVFQADPVQAIMNHLTATLPAATAGHSNLSKTKSTGNSVRKGAPGRKLHDEQRMQE